MLEPYTLKKRASVDIPSLFLVSLYLPQKPLPAFPMPYRDLVPLPPLIAGSRYPVVKLE